MHSPRWLELSKAFNRFVLDLQIPVLQNSANSCGGGWGKRKYSSIDGVEIVRFRISRKKKSNSIFSIKNYFLFGSFILSLHKIFSSMKTRWSGLFLAEKNTFCATKHAHRLIEQPSRSLLWWGRPDAILPWLLPRLLKPELSCREAEHLSEVPRGAHGRAAAEPQALP